MSARAGGALAVVASTLALSGCTVNGPDIPESPAPSSAESGAPPRPRELAVTGKQEPELCTLLTREQQAQLGVESPRPPAKDGNNDYPGCLWSTPLGQGGFGITIMAVPMGMSEFQDQKLGPPFPETAANYKVAGGFPAQQSQSSVGLENLGCGVLVDVAEGQTLWAFVGPDVPGTMNNQEMCAKAKQGAELAVTTLQGQG